MLPLVRSQRASLERLRAATRWTRGLVVFTGAPGQGKSTVIQALEFATPFSPLRLDGEVVVDRHDAVMRLTALVGLRPDSDDFVMLERLQSKQSSGTDLGVSEVIVEDAHCLPDEVLRFFSELASGIYGRPWSVLLVGENAVLDRLMALGVLPSTVQLPAWDLSDLREALAQATPQTQEPRGDLQPLLNRFAEMPKRLIRAALEARSEFPLEPEMASRGLTDRSEPEPERRLLIVWISGGLLAAVLIAYLWWQAQPPKAPSVPVVIPMTPKS